jgi:hypothetical protein
MGKDGIISALSHFDQKNGILRLIKTEKDYEYPLHWRCIHPFP